MSDTNKTEDQTRVKNVRQLQTENIEVEEGPVSSNFGRGRDTDTDNQELVGLNAPAEQTSRSNASIDEAELPATETTGKTQDAQNQLAQILEDNTNTNSQETTAKNQTTTSETPQEETKEETKEEAPEQDKHVQGLELEDINPEAESPKEDTKKAETEDKTKTDDKEKKGKEEATKQAEFQKEVQKLEQELGLRQAEESSPSPTKEGEEEKKPEELKEAEAEDKKSEQVINQVAKTQDDEAAEKAAKEAMLGGEKQESTLRDSGGGGGSNAGGSTGAGGGGNQPKSALAASFSSGVKADVAKDENLSAELKAESEVLNPIREKFKEEGRTLGRKVGEKPQDFAKTDTTDKINTTEEFKKVLAAYRKKDGETPAPTEANTQTSAEGQTTTPPSQPQSELNPREQEVAEKAFFSGFNLGYSEGAALRKEAEKNALIERQKEAQASPEYQDGAKAATLMNAATAAEQQEGKALHQKYLQEDQALKTEEAERRNKGEQDKDIKEALKPRKTKVGYYFQGLNATFQSARNQQRQAQQGAMLNSESYQNGRAQGNHDGERASRGESVTKPTNFEPFLSQQAKAIEASAAPEKQAEKKQELKYAQIGYYQGFNRNFEQTRKNDRVAQQKQIAEQQRKSPLFQQGYAAGEAQGYAFVAFTANPQASPGKKREDFTWDAHKKSKQNFYDTLNQDNQKLYERGFLQGLNASVTQARKKGETEDLGHLSRDERKSYEEAREKLQKAAATVGRLAGSSQAVLLTGSPEERQKMMERLESNENFKGLIKSTEDHAQAAQLLKPPLRERVKKLVPAPDGSHLAKRWDDLFEKSFKAGLGQGTATGLKTFRDEAKAKQVSDAGGPIPEQPEYKEGKDAAYEVMTLFFEAKNEIRQSSRETQTRVMTILTNQLNQTRNQAYKQQGKTAKSIDPQFNRTLETSDGQSIPAEQVTLFALGFHRGINQASEELQKSSNGNRTGNKDKRKNFTSNERTQIESTLGLSVSKEDKEKIVNFIQEERSKMYDAYYDYTRAVDPTQLRKSPKEQENKAYTDLKRTLKEPPYRNNQPQKIEKLVRDNMAIGKKFGQQDGAAYRLGYMKGYIKALTEQQIRDVKAGKKPADIEGQTLKEQLDNIELKRAEAVDKALKGLIAQLDGIGLSQINTKSDFFAEGEQVGYKKAEFDAYRNQQGVKMSDLSWIQTEAFQQGFQVGMKMLQAAYSIEHGIPMSEELNDAIGTDDEAIVEKLIEEDKKTGELGLSQKFVNQLAEHKKQEYRRSLVTQAWNKKTAEEKRTWLQTNGINLEDRRQSAQARQQIFDKLYEELKDFLSKSEADFFKGFQDASQKYLQGQSGETLRKDHAEVAGFVLGFLQEIYQHFIQNEAKRADVFILADTLHEQWDEVVLKSYEHLIITKPKSTTPQEEQTSAEPLSKMLQTVQGEITKINGVFNAKDKEEQSQDPNRRFVIHFNGALGQGKSAAFRTLAFARTVNGQTRFTLTEDYTRKETQSDRKGLEPRMEALEEALKQLQPASGGRIPRTFFTPEVIEDLTYLRVYVEDERLGRDAVSEMGRFSALRNGHANLFLQMDAFFSSGGVPETHLKARAKGQKEGERAVSAAKAGGNTKTGMSVLINFLSQPEGAEAREAIPQLFSLMRSELGFSKWAMSQIDPPRTYDETMIAKFFEKIKDGKEASEQFKNPKLILKDINRVEPRKSRVAYEGNFDMAGMLKGAATLGYSFDRGMDFTGQNELLSIKDKGPLKITAQGASIKPGPKKKDNGLEFFTVKVSMPILEARLRREGFSPKITSVNRLGLTSTGFSWNKMPYAQEQGSIPSTDSKAIEAHAATKLLAAFFGLQGSLKKEDKDQLD